MIKCHIINAIGVSKLKKISSSWRENLTVGIMKWFFVSLALKGFESPWAMKICYSSQIRSGVFALTGKLNLRIMKAEFNFCRRTDCFIRANGLQPDVENNSPEPLPHSFSLLILPQTQSCHHKLILHIKTSHLLSCISCKYSNPLNTFT